MVSLTEADSALKSYYLDVIAEQLDVKTNPLLAAIKKSASDIYGKDVVTLVTYGINGGIGAGAETGDLPASGGNGYRRMTASLKNLYGTIEISDKAIRASAGGAGAFVDLLTAEMEGLVGASAFNLGRMLFGDGSGVLAKVVGVSGNVVTVDDARKLTEGMIVDFMSAGGAAIDGAKGRQIAIVDRAANTVRVSGAALSSSAVPEDSIIVMQGSYNNELTGLEAIFNVDKQLYGMSRTSNPWLKPYVRELEGEIGELDIQTAMDEIETISGGKTNFIVCSLGVRRALQKLFSANIRNTDVVELAGGYRTISYNGIPIVADRFCGKGCMYLLNTDDFTMYQLCDWQWLEGEDGSVLRQVPGKAVYTATLVKYAELVCKRPCGQGLIKNITEA